MSDAVRTRKTPRNMGIGCLVAGALFLFDPFVGFGWRGDAFHSGQLCRTGKHQPVTEHQMASAKKL